MEHEDLYQLYTKYQIYHTEFINIIVFHYCLTVLWRLWRSGHAEGCAKRHSLLVKRDILCCL